MTQTTRRRSFSCWAACLMALGSIPTWAQAQAGGQVYIQGSEVNLRDKATATAKVVAKVAIGTECQPVKSASKQWVRLKCGDAEGFTLKSLVGAQKPTVEALLAQAQDTRQSAKARLDAAMRAATLDSENALALKLVSDLFFDVSFEQLLKDRRKGGLHETFKVKREVKSTYPKTTRESGEEALLRELEKREYEWHRFELRGSDFVSAMYWNGELVVYTGSFGSMGWMDIKDEDEQFLVGIESRSSSGVAETLKRALQQGARTAQQNEGKYSSIDQESPDMPALSAGALRLFQSLPGLWYELTDSETGEHYLRMGCGEVMGAELRVDLHRRANIWWHKLSGSGESNDSVRRVSSVTKTATGLQLELRTRNGLQESLTLLWPTAEANVALWDRKPYAGRRYYLAVNGRHNVRIDNSPCSSTDE